MSVHYLRQLIHISYVVMLFGGAVFSQQPDSPYVRIPEGLSLYDTAEIDFPTYDPLKAVGLSALLPGAGQAYTSAWIRGGSFFTAELITSLVMIDRLGNWDEQKQNTEELNALVQQLQQRVDSASGSVSDSLALEQRLQENRISLKLSRYERKQAKYAAYHAIGWTAGIYVWNLMDALGASNYFKTTEPKKPVLAGWLSAIPGLGLGQIYNQAYSKAAMIWTIQTMLGLMAYDYNRLMESAAEYRSEYVPDNPEVAQVWQGRYNDAFTRRNMYLWYSVFFYFYGVFDAVVDAHLHDYPRQIRFEPVVESTREKVGLTAVVCF